MWMAPEPTAMPAIDATTRIRGRRTEFRDEALSWLAGAMFTLLLFLGLARLEGVKPSAPPAQIEDLRLVAASIEPPPPPRVPEAAEPVDAGTGVVGLEVGASDSPVKIAVVPADLAAMFPPTDNAPRAEIRAGKLYSELRPRVDVSSDFRRVYQPSDVDQQPTVVHRAVPRIPRYVRKKADTLRVTLLIIVNEKGIVSSVRVLKPSGNPQFDEIVSECVRYEWAFTPAVKAGKAVKCMLQQPVTIIWGKGNPFSA